jgi:hypothetical protein
MRCNSTAHIGLASCAQLVKEAVAYGSTVVSSGRPIVEAGVREGDDGRRVPPCRGEVIVNVAISGSQSDVAIIVLRALADGSPSPSVSHVFDGRSASIV